MTGKTKSRKRDGSQNHALLFCETCDDWAKVLGATFDANGLTAQLSCGHSRVTS